MLVLLGVLVFVYNLGVGIYYARGLETSPTFESSTLLHSSAASFGGSTLKPATLPLSRSTVQDYLSALDG